jgi:omega-hydroxy-beta-dihydromenaquinone-9 sulfotransferase
MYFLKNINIKKYIKRNLIEAIRLFVNYHPASISKMWKNSYKSYLKNKNNQRVILVKYEDITSQPEIVLSKVYNFLNLNWNPEISNLIRTNNSNKWKNDLKNWELSSIESILKNEMLENQYLLANKKNTYTNKIFSKIIFYFKAPFILFLNFNRSKNILSDFKKRFK